MKRSLNIGIALIAMLLLLGCNFDLPNTAKAVDDNATVTSGQSVTIDVLANDEDTSGVHDPAKWIRHATQPAHGTVVVDKNLTITYTADAGFVGKDRFTYTLGIRDMTDDGNVTVTVTPAPLPPVALPRADAGEDKEVVAGKSVDLNGTCFAATGTIESCIWYEGGRKLPDQQALHGNAVSANAQSIRVTYTPTSVGIHTLRLVAIDGNSQRAEDTANVHVTDPGQITHAKLVFPWNDGSHGQEPWVSDGTVSGTIMLKNIAPDGDGSSPEFSKVMINGETFFAATEEGFDRELWKTDGTADGTVKIVDIASGIGHGSWPRDLCRIDDMVYFFALDGNTSDSNNWDGNTSIWKSTGEIGNAVKVEDFGSFGGTGYSAPGYLRCVGDKLFFQKDYDSGNGPNWNPWVNNGTGSSTRLSGSTFEGASKRFMWGGVIYNGIYYARGNDGSKGDEVWGWNYAIGAVSLFKDINEENNKGSNPSNFIVANDKLFFTAENARTSGDPEAYDKSLWVSDGSSANTRVIKDDTATPPAVGSRDRFSDLTVMDTRLYFVYLNLDENNDTIGIGTLWSTDGSAVNLVQDIDVVSGTLNATTDTLFFQADGNASMRGLWTSDGTETGTHRVKAFGPNVYWYDSFVKDGLYYFILDDADNGKRELWRSDGTALGTLKLLATDHAPG